MNPLRAGMHAFHPISSCRASCLPLFPPCTERSRLLFRILFMASPSIASALPERLYAKPYLLPIQVFSCQLLPI